MPVKHLFVSPKTDDPDTTLIRPTNWNADHDITGMEVVANKGANSGYAALDASGFVVAQGIAIGADTSIYRQSADILRTDDTLRVARLFVDMAAAYPHLAGYIPLAAYTDLSGSGEQADQAFLGADALNRLRGANSGRYTITQSNLSNMAALFDGGYDTGCQVAAGLTGQVTIDFNPQLGWTANGNNGFTYAQGYLVLTFYDDSGGSRKPTNIQVEGYWCNSGTDQWSTWLNTTTNTKGQVVVAVPSVNWLKQIRVTYSHNSGTLACSMTEIEYFPTRPAETASLLYIPRYTSGNSRIYGGFDWNGDTNLYRSAADTLKTDDSLVVGGAFALLGDITTTDVGTQNDYNPTGFAAASVVRLNPASALTITGFVPGANAEGRIVTLMNVSSQVITFLSENTGSTTAANRMTLPEGAVVLGQNEVMTLMYDNVAARWRPLTRVTMSLRAEFSKTGVLAVGAGTSRWYNDTGRTLAFRRVRVSVGTAPTGAALIVDVNKNGTTVFTTQTNRPQVAVSTNTITANTFNVTSIADGEYLTVDVDQIGSTVAGSDMTVQVWML